MRRSRPAACPSVSPRLLGGRCASTLPIALLLLPVVAVVLASPAVALAQSRTGQAEPATGDTTGLNDLSPAELFLRASSSALQFQHMRAPSRRVLVRQHDRTLPYLVTKLDTDDARERHALEDVLVRIGQPAVQPLLRAFGEELERTDTSRGARMAATALGRLADPEAIAALPAGGDHGDWKVRSATASALGRIAHPDAAGPLLTLIEDPNEMVRKSAVVGLARVAEADSAALDDEAMAGLCAAFDDGYYAVRFGAARALAACGERALDLLEEIIEGGAERPRLLAIETLGRVATHDARALLRGLARSPSWIARAHVARALGAADPGDAEIATLRELALDTHPLVATSAREALLPK